MTTRTNDVAAALKAAVAEAARAEAAAAEAARSRVVRRWRRAALVAWVGLLVFGSARENTGFLMVTVMGGVLLFLVSCVIIEPVLEDWQRARSERGAPGGRRR